MRWTEEQLAQIDALILKRQEASRGIEALDTFRSASKDLFVDFASGTKSMGDAFDDFARRLRQRALELIAEKLIEQIFGAFGTAGGGGALEHPEAAAGAQLAELEHGCSSRGRERNCKLKEQATYRV